MLERQDTTGMDATRARRTSFDPLLTRCVLVSRWVMRQGSGRRMDIVCILIVLLFFAGLSEAVSRLIDRL